VADDLAALDQADIVVIPGWLPSDLLHPPFSPFACSVSSLVATLSHQREERP
jgi:hypothetical protein